MDKLNIGIIIASTRDERVGDKVGKWVYDNAKELKENVNFELVDLIDYELPFVGKKDNEFVQPWKDKMNSFDGYIFILPEYNRMPPAEFKNAMDHLYKEVEDKAVAFVGYGGFGGMASVSSIRSLTGQLGIASLSQTVNFTLRTDFKDNELIHSEHHKNSLNRLIEKLEKWSMALKTIR